MCMGLRYATDVCGGLLPTDPALTGYPVIQAEMSDGQLHIHPLCIAGYRNWCTSIMPGRPSALFLMKGKLVCRLH